MQFARNSSHAMQNVYTPSAYYRFNRKYISFSGANFSITLSLFSCYFSFTVVCKHLKQIVEIEKNPMFTFRVSHSKNYEWHANAIKFVFLLLFGWCNKQKSIQEDVYQYLFFLLHRKPSLSVCVYTVLLFLQKLSVFCLYYTHTHTLNRIIIESRKRVKSS